MIDTASTDNTTSIVENRYHVRSRAQSETHSKSIDDELNLLLTEYHKAKAESL